MRCVIAVLVLMATIAGNVGARIQPRPHGTKVELPVLVVNLSGDTFRVWWGDGDEETVHILGIATPALDEEGGPEAYGFLSGALRFARHRQMKRADTLDGSGRTLAYLFLDGENYSQVAVASIMAHETVSLYGDSGFPEEAKALLLVAQAVKTNLAKSRQETCDIKGNISANGERIYHIPGDQYYSRTTIDLSKGERWFCSEEEAQAAGWRRSRK